MRSALAAKSGSGLHVQERVRWCESPASCRIRRSVSAETSIPPSARWSRNFASDQRVSATPWLSGRGRRGPTPPPPPPGVWRRRLPRRGGQHDHGPLTLGLVLRPPRDRLQPVALLRRQLALPM